MARYNNKRKQSLMMCMVCIMLFIFGVTAGISYAYFSNSKDVTNTLNFGKLIISTKGEKTTTVTLTPNQENGMTEENGVYKIAVNDTVSIAGSIGLEENSVPAYIRMKVEMTDQNSNRITGAFKTGFMAQMAEMIDTTNSKQWFVVGNYLYLGNEINASSPFVFSESNTNISEATAEKNKIKMTNEMLTNEIAGNQITITFTLQAIQSAGMTKSDGTTAVGTLTGYTEDNAEIIAGIPVWSEIYFDALDENALGVYEAPAHTGNAMDARGTFREGRKNSEGKYTHIELGTYPQTFHSTDGKGLTKVENKTYTLYNNALSGAGVKTDYAIYTDGTDEYVEITTVRSSSSSSVYSDGETKISSSGTAYFKLEPIVWEILGVTDADGNVTAGGYDGKTAGVKLLLSSVKILTAMAFDSSGSTTYNGSTVQTYLNGGFFSSAFTDDERDNIAETALVVGENEDATKTNDATTCKRVADGDETTTRHKVFLLSASDLLNKAYGYKTDTAYTSDETRIKYPTDYAGANYAYRDSSANYGGLWWSRSAYSSCNSVWSVNSGGNLYYYFPYYASNGVVPALFLLI